MGYIRLFNKNLCLTVSQFCLKFFCPRVHNFTNYNLSLSESYLLSLGLNFRPSPLPISVHSRKKQLEEFSRSIRIKHFFVIWVSGQFEHYAYAYHLVRSDWTPPICLPYIEIPLLAIRHELCAISPQEIKHKPNLSTHEFATLRKLFANKNIFILPSDKNLGPTIVTSRWYEEELSRLLSDKKFYDAVECPLCYYL